MKQLQFELWKECNSKCTFCYLGDTNKFTSDEIKIHNLEKVIKIISNTKIYTEYDTLAFIGGEFYQGQLKNKNVRDLFFKMWKKVYELGELGFIKNAWTSATLTIGDQKDLYDILDIFKNSKINFWILSSYDTIGRFHSQKMFENWDYHLKNIKTLYPFVNINITTIITGDLIEKYLTNDNLFKNLIKTYSAALFIKLPAHADGKYISKSEANLELGNFFPERNKFLRFLKKIKQNDSELYNKLFNIDYRADTLLCEYHSKSILAKRDKKTKLETYDPTIDSIMSCGHLTLYAPYIDSDCCAMCDKINIDKLM